MLSSRELNHKWNYSGNFKSVTAYLNDVTELQKLIKFPAYKIYPYKHVILCIHTHFYQVNKFLPIFTQSAKTIQTEFLII